MLARLRLIQRPGQLGALRYENRDSITYWSRRTPMSAGEECVAISPSRRMFMRVIRSPVPAGSTVIKVTTQNVGPSATADAAEDL
jgi:hypothetical protein